MLAGLEPLFTVQLLNVYPLSASVLIGYEIFPNRIVALAVNQLLFIFTAPPALQPVPPTISNV